MGAAGGVVVSFCLISSSNGISSSRAISTISRSFVVDVSTVVVVLVVVVVVVEETEVVVVVVVAVVVVKEEEKIVASILKSKYHQTPANTMQIVSPNLRHSANREKLFFFIIKLFNNQ
jgi:hypothetical protein